MSDKVRFNFVLSNEVESRLANYSDSTHRNTADVVRQVLIEWLDGDLVLHRPLADHPTGRRTNITLPNVVRNALEERVTKEGHVSLSAVVNALLGRFLAPRAASLGGDAVTVRLPVPLPLYQKLSAASCLRGEDVERTILNCLTARVDDMVIALKEENA
jgi:hypothetical protein